MLTQIRDRSSGLFAWAIAALIIIPMAFWGVQEYVTTEARPTIVKVGDQKIRQDQFRSQLQNTQQRYRQLLGDQTQEEFLNTPEFKKNVLNGMINRAIVRQVADDYNYQISDELLVELIKNSPNFQQDGKFDQQTYEQYLQSTLSSRTQFESQFRTSQRLSQVTSGYKESALVLPDDVRELLSIQVEERDIEVLSVKKNDFKEGIKLDEQQIKDYYENNQDQFMEPERISVDYVGLSLDLLKSEVDVDEEEIKAIYEQNQDSYSSEETRLTRHILLSINNDNPADKQLAKAKELIEKLNNGSDFAELAKEHSQDPGSAAKGGDLGKVLRGQMVPEFEKATFEIEEGAISEPIKSQFGYHIIQVTKINEHQIKPFDEVKDEIKKAEIDRLAEDLLLERVEELRDLAFEQSDNLDGIAEVMDLKIKTSPLFSKETGAGIAQTAAVRNAAFSDEVLLEELNSEPVVAGENHYVVLRKKDYKASAPKPLAKAEAQIKTILTDEKASELVNQKAEELLSKANNDWAALAEEHKKEIKTHTISLAVQTPVVPNEVRAEVFKLKLADGKPVVKSVNAINGDVHLFRLSKISPGDVDKANEQLKERTRQLFVQRNGDALANDYLEYLREQYTPEIDQDLL